MREHFSDPSVRKSIDVDLTLVAQYDTLITDLELTIVREAKRHDADAFHRLRSVPGIGKVLALTKVYSTVGLLLNSTTGRRRSVPLTRGGLIGVRQRAPMFR